MSEEAKKPEERERIWRAALKLIKDLVPASSFKAWIKPAQLKSIEGKTVHLEVRNEFSKNLLIQNYYSQIANSFCQLLESEVNLVINVNGNLVSEEYLPNFSSIEDSNRQASYASQSGPTQDSTSYAPNYEIPDNSPIKLGFQQNKWQSNLNPKFVFDNFIVGSHNQFCHAAALAIAKNKPSSAYNPFFLYGDVGLGKTHLMHSIGNYILSKNPDAKVLYISTEQFLNDLIAHMRKSKMNEFRARYRSLDLLLVDDIQFIEGKETTQEEFFHTFNSLKDNGSQIILTSDRPPKDITRLEPRLCSRFEGGLLADVQKPTYETRLAIIARKSEELKLKLISNVADLIAKAFPENIRTLEGALFKLHAYRNFTNANLNAEAVCKLLQINPNAFAASELNAMSSGNSIPIMDNKVMYRIKDLVSTKLGIPVEEFMSRSNSKEIKNARQICMYVARKTGLSLGEISKSFDGRGNSAIINAVKRIQEDSEADQNLRSLLEELIQISKS